MPALLTVAIPPALRVCLATQAAAQGLTQDALADQVLRALLPLTPPADSAAWLHRLTDPRLAGTNGGSPTIHVDRDLAAAAQQLAAHLSQQIGRTVAKGRVLQAALWDALDPLPPEVARTALPSPAEGSTLTVAIPAALHAALQTRASAMQLRLEALVDQLLITGWADLMEDAATIGTLAQETRIQPSDGRGTTIIRVQRHHDASARLLAEQAFHGVKSHALQALLWYGLDHADEDTDTPPPDRPVLISGPLYARVAQAARQSTRPDGGRMSIREFVHQALEGALQGKKLPTDHSHT